jgi:glucosamine--fructose-6-phosphate aminotransferase (isomerizing)
VPVGPATRLESELLEQGAVLASRADAGRQSARAAADLLRSAGTDYLLLGGRGSSDNVARYAQYLLGMHAGISAGLAAPWLFAGDFPAPSLRRGAVLAVSQSGGSPDVVALLAGARKQGRPAIALTNQPDSPLAATADVVVPLGAGPERSVAATKSYTASLHAVAQLALALRPDPDMERWLERAPRLVAEVVEEQLASRARFDVLGEAAWLTVVGRGLNYATAHETALKLRELSGTPAEAFSPPDLLHGPVAALGPATGLWVVSVGGGRQPDSALTGALRERVGGMVAVSDDAELLADADVAVRLPDGLPAWVAPLAAVVPGQVAALRLAELRGVDIDAPHGLSKVTLTS